MLSGNFKFDAAFCKFHWSDKTIAVTNGKQQKLILLAGRNSGYDNSMSPQKCPELGSVVSPNGHFAHNEHPHVVP
ncbi:unnamed protein product [Dibothriocephalus latus]|uniref:Uncharacterized protein n=1 Tax=Dibothriocephalus latus TaxID=60516 RepID=A0A3P6VA87_DIBLA|nr:unnamed protein product [Dibothriocephalus latus]